MVSSTTDHDLLNFKGDEAVTGFFENGEELIFSCIVQKQNKYGVMQKRNLMLTTTRLHNLEAKKIKRSIKVDKIKALTKNILNDNKEEFLVHVQGEYDYRFRSEDRELIFRLIIDQN